MALMALMALMAQSHALNRRIGKSANRQIGESVDGRMGRRSLQAGKSRGFWCHGGEASSGSGSTKSRQLEPIIVQVDDSRLGVRFQVLFSTNRELKRNQQSTNNTKARHVGQASIWIIGVTADCSYLYHIDSPAQKAGIRAQLQDTCYPAHTIY